MVVDGPKEEVFSVVRRHVVGGFVFGGDPT